MRLERTQKRIRQEILKLSHKSKTSHIGSSLSCVDIIFIIYKYFIKKQNSFILSKGHAALAYYYILSIFGYISKKDLNTFGKNNSKLMSHVSHKVNGIEFSTGSLGHGLPYAAGKALGYKRKKKNKKKIYVLISDGELNEGTTWESLLFASFHNLDNLVIIVDYNKIQSLDYTKNILELEPLKKKFLSFNCYCTIIDGHNLKILKRAINKKTKKPHVIIANTIKGSGISFMENKIEWHYKFPDQDQLNNALKELK